MNSKEILERADWRRVAKLSVGIAGSGALFSSGLRRGGASGLAMATIGGYFLRRWVVDAIDRPPFGPRAYAHGAGPRARVEPETSGGRSAQTAFGEPTPAASFRETTKGV